MTQITDDELREVFIEKYMEIAAAFYYEGSSEEYEREKYAPEFADEMIKLFHTYAAAEKVGEDNE